LLQREFARSKLRVVDQQNWLRRLVPKLSHISGGKTLRLLTRVLDPGFLVLWPIKALSRKLVTLVEENVDGILEVRLAAHVEKERLHEAMVFLGDRMAAFHESMATLRRGVPEAEDVRDIAFSIRALNRDGRSDVVNEGAALLANDFIDQEPDMAIALQRMILDKTARKDVVKAPGFMTSASMHISRQDRVK
jgi:hypothetical protein